jgi:hypothetical protein
MPLWYAPALIARLHRLLAGGVRGHWLTSWGRDAADHLAPAVGFTGAADWPVLAAVDTETRADAWWKADAVADHLAASDADLVVCVDDDIADWHRHAAPSLAGDPRLVTLSPAVDRGLLPAHLDLPARHAHPNPGTGTRAADSGNALGGLGGSGLGDPGPVADAGVGHPIRRPGSR